MFSTAILLSLAAAPFADTAQNVRDAASRAQIPGDLMVAICSVESSLRPKAVRHEDGDGTSSYGVCQIKLITAQAMGYRGDEAGLFNPWRNAYYAAKYVRHLLRRYHGDLNSAISAYNMGHVSRTAGGSFKNQKYVDKVHKELVRVTNSR